MTLEDGGIFVEEITGHSDDEMSYEYRIVESPLPVSGFTSRVSVVADEAGSRATWAADFEVVDVPAADIEAMVQGLYEAGLQALAEKS